jgi:hypothetical protein
VGTGILPRGGGSERLPRLVGRDRALEAILSSNDYDADLAERYGCVTRTIADAELDRFVDGKRSYLPMIQWRSVAHGLIVPFSSLYSTLRDAGSCRCCALSSTSSIARPLSLRRFMRAQ